MVLASFAFYFYWNQCTPFPTSKSAPPQYHSIFSMLSLSPQEGSNGLIDSTSAPREQPSSVSFEMLFTALQKFSLFFHGLPSKIPDSTPAHPFILPADTRLTFLNLIFYFNIFKVFPPLLQSYVLLVENLEMSRTV